ncbi:unnamed protein product [Trifolium pratense]|uniref:Uncharacterized protein n=1 Tax=Trifolium pratense TaxID=57577 RepID=A0ACB0LCK8_TRIPR|nr:unnamed protein product [Trifolium pratense]
MTKNLKLVPTIILFVFLFLFTEEVASNTEMTPKLENIQTSIKCKTYEDCPDIVVVPQYIQYVCTDGYCHKLFFRGLQ